MDFLLPGSFCPAAAKGMSEHLRHCSPKRGVALTQVLPPLCPRPRAVWGQRFTAVRLSRGGLQQRRCPVPSRSSGRAVPPQRQREECGPGRTEASYSVLRGAEKPLRRFDLHPRGASPGLRPRLCPSKSAQPTRSLRIVLLPFWSFYSQCL